MRILVHQPRWSHWAPPVIWALILVAMSGDFGSSHQTYYIFRWVLSTFVNLPPKTIIYLHFWFRKSLHFLCYGILSVLWFRALIITFPEHPSTSLILTLVFCLGVSLIDEGHQFLLTSRTGALRDVGLDMAGAVLFMFSAARYWKREVTVSSGAKPPFP